MAILIDGLDMPEQGEFKHLRIYDNGDVTVDVGDGEAVIAHAIPATDVRPVRRGKWVQGDMPTYGGYKCSVCGANTVQYKANFCPNCGADMREES